MNRILLISISLLAFFVAVAGASAAEYGAVCDNCTCVVDGDAVAFDVNDAVSQEVDVANVVDSVSNDAVDNVVEVENEEHAANHVVNSPASSDIHHFNKQYPDFVGVTKEKYDSLKGEIDKYTQHFKKPFCSIDQ